MRNLSSSHRSNRSWIHSTLSCSCIWYLCRYLGNDVSDVCSVCIWEGYTQYASAQHNPPVLAWGRITLAGSVEQQPVMGHRTIKAEQWLANRTAECVLYNDNYENI